MTMTNAVVLIEAERDALSALGGELADIEGVAEAYSVTGEWDFVAIVRVLSSRWRTASPRARAAVIAACAAVVALVLGAVLTLENATYSHGGSVPFGFSYRTLYRVRPDPGGYVKVQRHRADGSLEDS